MEVVESQQLPLSSGLDVDEESPFLRGRQAASARRRHRRTRSWVLAALFVSLVVLPVGWAGYSLAFFVLTSPRFQTMLAEDAILTGNRFVTTDEVLNALGVPVARSLGSGMNIFRLGLEEKRRQVEAVAWVRSATLARAFPNRLAVFVIERTPVAFVNLGGHVKLVDGEGVVLERPDKAVFDFPVLTGLGEAEDVATRRLKLALYGDFMQGVSQPAAREGWVISEVDLADPDDLKALLIRDDSTILVHFGHEAFQERFENFLVLLPELLRSHPRLDSIDLRYRDQIVVNPQPSRSQGGEVREPTELVEDR